MIKVENITKSFEGVPVLKEVTTLFERGKTNLIIGQSGSGKTVLMKCLVGLLESDSGKIMFDNLDFNKMSFADRRIIRKQLGMLFQGGALFDSLTVEENVIFPLNMFSDLSQEEKLDRANFCLQRVNLDNVNHLYPSEISGGMKKRVAIARAIANNPSFLFCDEPNSGLDPRTAIVIDKLISEITQEFNMTTVINTHDMNSVMAIGEKLVFLYQGKKEWEGSKDDILHADNKALNDFVFASEMARLIKKPRS